MIFNLYAVIVLLSFIMVLVLIGVGHKQIITDYLLIFVAVMVAGIGHYIISTSSGLEAALVGHRISYLGGVFTPVLLFFSVTKMCKIKIPKILAGGLGAYCLIILYFAFSVPSRTDYYSSVSIGREYGMTYLVKEYGPMHSIYIIFLLGCMLAMIGVIVYAHFKKKNVSVKITSGLLIMGVVTISLYFFRRVIGSSIEWFTVAYILDEVALLFLIRRIGMYEVSESIAQSLGENSTHGYIIFDKKMRFLGSNKAAEAFVPEIKNLKIDSTLSKDVTPVLYDMYGESGHIIYDKEDIVEKGGRVLKCSIKRMYHGKWKRNVGYFIEFIDDTQQQQYLQLLNNYYSNLEEEVFKKTEHISKMQDKLVLGMADMIENRDNSTGGHIKRTSFVIRIFTDELQNYCEKYGYSKEFLNNVVKAAPMHDLGKIAVDDRILRKPGKYTPEEYEEMKKHAEKGAEIISQILIGVEDEQFLRIAKNVAHYHHEKWNGEGYPDHLSGVKIPLEARIMALADVFDTLVSKRCYKEKMDYDSAFKIIEDSLGTHFDPELGRLFLKCRARLETFYNGLEERT